MIGKRDPVSGKPDDEMCDALAEAVHAEMSSDHEPLDNPPAFPCERTERVEYPGVGGTITTYHETGMTLLDYFATRAMTALVIPIDSPEVDPSLAERAYHIAEALLRERQRRMKP